MRLHELHSLYEDINITKCANGYTLKYDGTAHVTNNHISERLVFTSIKDLCNFLEAMDKIPTGL